MQISVIVEDAWLTKPRSSHLSFFVPLLFSVDRFTLGPAPAFLYGSGTLVLSTKVPHPHFSVITFLHKIDIILSLVYVHRDIR